MPTKNTRSRRRSRRRTPLTRARVLEAAVALADEKGLEALSMRRLGAELGVEAMSLYNHVTDKDDLLDGIVEVVVSGFESPRPLDREDWRATLRRCAIKAHEILLRHPWSAALAESRRQNGPERLTYYDELLGTLRADGFSDLAAYRANLILDSYLYGFTLQEVNWPTADSDPGEMAEAFVDRTPTEAYPNLLAVARLATNGEMDIAADFEVGLDVVLDALEAVRDAE